MKCLIGVLYSGESQFESCKASIRMQSHTDWELIEVKHLPNKEAHSALFSQFMSHAESVDIFVKIDADMVLCHADFLKTLCEYFTTHTHIDHVTMKVDDFFTGRLIWGLNAFRSSVVFEDNDDVYTDKAAIVRPDAISQIRQHKILVPAALHAFDPSDYQAFYFGCHKAVKVMHRQSRSHMRNIRRLPMAAVKRRDKRPLLAYSGAAMAFERQLQPGTLDHGNTEIDGMFRAFAESSANRGVAGLLRNWRTIVAAKSRYLG